MVAKFELNESHFRRDVNLVPGLHFLDIMPLLKDREAFKSTVDLLAARVREEFPEGIDYVAGIELRGVPFASALAYALGVGNVVARKKGKLPGLLHSSHYQTEYSFDQLEVQQDAVEPGAKVVVVDDLIATGASFSAVYDCLKKCQASVVGLAVPVEFPAAGGREKLQQSHPDVKLVSLVSLTYRGQKPKYDPADYEKERRDFLDFVSSCKKKDRCDISSAKEQEKVAKES
ncbi:phosphoribosyltransferase like protein [Babesia gibsoni]|uniref:adenine phosphoribosyltransferase n=1 Tax=Babesia gibsoni TaxID=33632 RepID=A0AAD8LIJ6_BABGI|nr:phosphoribosyltransferase like protein [Babesia gibsoni]